MFFSFSQFEKKILFAEVSFNKHVDFSNCLFLDSVKFNDSKRDKALFAPNYKFIP